MIYDAAAHEPLTEREWDAAFAEDAVRRIVADAERALDGDAWPPHELDAEEGDPGPWTVLYLGTAGVVWALHRLGSSLPLAALAHAALERYRDHPDFGEAIPGLYLGESGILLVRRLVGGDAGVERLRELVVANERNPAWELFWGSAGTMIAAREAGLDEECRRSADLLAEAWDGMWTQEIDGRRRQFFGPAHGYAGNVHALRGFVDDDELSRRVDATMRAHAVREDGLVNWPPRIGDDCTRTQWCHGAPGIVATLGDLLAEDLLLGAAELAWHAGPLSKGSGLCHGTAGNGYAFLRVYDVTGDGLWLERARRFAMHALEQVERGPGRYSLFTGDVGVALFARSCIDADPRFPTMDVW